MQHQNPPRIWNAFIVPSLLGIFYCVLLCLSYPHLPSIFPAHFNTAGTPDRWAATGPMLLASLVALALVFLVLGISTIRSAEKQIAWWITGILFAGFIGATVGASVEFLHSARAFRGFHTFAWLAWALAAAAAQALFLLIPRRPRPAASSANAAAPDPPSGDAPAHPASPLPAAPASAQNTTSPDDPRHQSASA